MFISYINVCVINWCEKNFDKFCIFRVIKENMFRSFFFDVCKKKNCSWMAAIRDVNVMLCMGCWSCVEVQFVVYKKKHYLKHKTTPNLSSYTIFFFYKKMNLLVVHSSSFELVSYLKIFLLFICFFSPPGSLSCVFQNDFFSHFTYSLQRFWGL